MSEMPDPKPLIVSCVEDGHLRGDVAAAPVRWWSLTKTCLAACALILVARGRLVLDEPLPGRAYTLRQLLQHTSGLGSYTARPEYLAGVERKDPPWTDAEVLARVRLDPFLFDPGEGWAYSNTGYFLVRRLIEQTTDTDIDTALRTLVLLPLGIGQTRVARQPADLDGCAWGNPQAYHPGWVFHGLLVGPPAEAALFVHRLLTGDFLPPHLRAAMRERRAFDAPPSGRPWRTAGYGLGLMIDIASPHGACLGHTGQGPDSVAAAYHFPDLDPPRTVAAFAPCGDQAYVERAVLDAAGRAE
jgi:D-alanyl-D-alanine carboxypeptidase